MLLTHVTALVYWLWWASCHLCLCVCVWWWTLGPHNTPLTMHKSKINIPLVISVLVITLLVILPSTLYSLWYSSGIIMPHLSRMRVILLCIIDLMIYSISGPGQLYCHLVQCSHSQSCRMITHLSKGSPRNYDWFLNYLYGTFLVNSPVA